MAVRACPHTTRPPLHIHAIPQVLFHVFENDDGDWNLESKTDELSASLIYAEQAESNGPIPTYNHGITGVVLRPEYTRVLCGCGSDCGASCEVALKAGAGEWCEPSKHCTSDDA